jgi:3-phenylpropionate/trans-cinnamate dioxygenase ferredoxin subunit
MVPVCRLDDLSPGDTVRIEADVPLAIFNVGGELFAIDDTCTHQDASLADGWLDGHTVECPLHASCFDLRTGRPTGAPAKRPVRTHPILVQDGMIYVQVGAPATDLPAAAA